MSLNWLWKNVVGEVKNNNDYKTYIYEGNAFLIFIDETKEEYALSTFFVDEQHAKNCLGLSKDYDGTPTYYQYKKYVLSLNSKNCMKFVNLLTKAKIPCEIQLVEKYEDETHKEMHNNYNFKD